MKKEITAETKRLAGFLLINTVLCIVLYFWVTTTFEFPYMPAIYLLVGVGVGLYYLIYNRGFALKNATPDMLPSHLSPVEKQRMLEDAKQRAHNSRWALTIIVPIVLTILADMIYLFIFPYFEGIFV